MRSSKLPANRQLEQLLTGPLQDIVSFSNTAADGSVDIQTHPIRLLRLLLDRLHKVFINLLYKERSPTPSALARCSLGTAEHLYLGLSHILESTPESLCCAV